MHAELVASGPTRGPARPYHGLMRTSTLFALTLSLAPILACNEDAPTRPEDGTVEPWDSCVWEGQLTRALCRPELACAWNGICVPRCESVEECPSFDGFTSECSVDSEASVCRVRCTKEVGCPETDGVPLKCSNTFCVRDP